VDRGGEVAWRGSGVGFGHALRSAGRPGLCIVTGDSPDPSGASMWVVVGARRVGGARQRDVRRGQSLCDSNALSHLTVYAVHFFISCLFLSSVKKSRARLIRQLLVWRYLACSQSQAGHFQQFRPAFALLPLTAALKGKR